MPHVILLNGVSSAGKSSIARVLQRRLDRPYLHVCIDTFEEMIPERRGEGGEFARRTVFDNMLSGFHHSLAALARCGNNLIVDHVMIEDDEHPNWVRECLTQLEPNDVFIVGVHCSLEELERREGERGDRPAGLARWQYPRFHVRITYDFEVDTSLTSAEECARQIAEALPLSDKHGLAATLRLLKESGDAESGGPTSPPR